MYIKYFLFSLLIISNSICLGQDTLPSYRSLTVKEINLYRLEENKSDTKNIILIEKKKDLLNQLNNYYKTFITSFSPFTHINLIQENEDYFLELTNKKYKLIARLYETRINYSQNSFLALGSNNCYQLLENQNCYPGKNGNDCISRQTNCVKIITKNDF